MENVIDLSIKRTSRVCADEHPIFTDAQPLDADVFGAENDIVKPVLKRKRDPTLLQTAAKIDDWFKTNKDVDIEEVLKKGSISTRKEREELEFKNGIMLELQSISKRFYMHTRRIHSCAAVCKYNTKVELCQMLRNLVIHSYELDKQLDDLEMKTEK